MGLITQQYTAVTGDTLTAARWNTEFQNILTLVNGNIENANIKAAAAIAYSKLNLSASIVNADISASAAIAYSKLNLTGAILDADLAGSISASKITNTAATLSDTQTLSNKTLTLPTLAGLTVPADDHTSTGTVTLDCTDASQFDITLNASTNLTISNMSEDQPILVNVLQGTGGSKLINWDSSILWAGGSSPTLTTTEGKVDTFGFLKKGSYIRGFIVGQNIATS